MTSLTPAYGRRNAQAVVDDAKVSKPHRVQIDLSPSAMDRLDDLKEKIEAASYAEVMKNALKLYAGIIQEVENGSEFLVRDKSGKTSAFKMFL
jgi:hypothetical protein